MDRASTLQAGAEALSIQRDLRKSELCSYLMDHTLINAKCVSLSPELVFLKESEFYF